MWGKHDFVFNEGFLNEWRTRFPGAESHLFEDAGHYVVEDARDRILPLMEAFLARTDRPRAPITKREVGGAAHAS